MKEAHVVPWRCHVCGTEFIPERGGLCESCGRLTCDVCWARRPGFLPPAHLERQCKACAVKVATPAGGEQVVLMALPPGFLNGLPDEDVRAIAAIVGKAVTLVGYDEQGRAELEFDDPFGRSTDSSSRTHTISVPPRFIATRTP